MTYAAFHVLMAKLRPHLEAEESDGVDDVILSGGADSRQHRRHVVHPETEEEQEAQQMAPDTHRLVGQDEEAAQRISRHNHN